MKNFTRWFKEKVALENKENYDAVFREREIWWASVGINIGDEEDGKNEYSERPVVIFKKFSKRSAWILPMTTKSNEGIYYHKLTHDGFESFVILSQLRLVSSKRLRRKIRKISPKQFSEIQSKIIGLIRSTPITDETPFGVSQ